MPGSGRHFSWFVSIWDGPVLHPHPFFPPYVAEKLVEIYGHIHGKNDDRPLNAGGSPSCDSPGRNRCFLATFLRC